MICFNGHQPRPDCGVTLARNSDGWVVSHCGTYAEVDLTAHLTTIVATKDPLLCLSVTNGYFRCPGSLLHVTAYGTPDACTKSATLAPAGMLHLSRARAVCCVHLPYSPFSPYVTLRTCGVWCWCAYCPSGSVCPKVTKTKLASQRTCS